MFTVKVILAKISKIFFTKFFILIPISLHNIVVDYMYDEKYFKDYDFKKQCGSRYFQIKAKR